MAIEQAVRLGWGLTRFGLHLVGEAARIPLKIAGGLLGHDDPPQQRAAPARPTPAAAPSPPPPRPERAAPARPAPTPPPQREEPAAQPPREAAPASLAELESEEPLHVDVEVELVGEFSEVGAEDGAGAEIHVDPPWDGYSRMKVAAIQERVQTASQAELAVVQLYEGTHRNRRSVLDAVERRSKELGAANGR